MKLRQFMEGQRKNRKSFSQRRRLEIWKQAHGRCWYCGTDTPKTWFVLEHVQPFSRGGADSARNLVVSCCPCDKAKGSKTLEEFRAKRGGGDFYGELRRPLAADLMAKASSTEAERKARRDAGLLKKERIRQLNNPRMVQLSEAFKKCGHPLFSSVADASAARDDVERLGRVRAEFRRCEHCGEWRVGVMSHAGNKAINSLLRQQRPVTVLASAYIN